jgi:hypothetical protein
MRYKAGNHPLSIMGKLPAAQITKLIKEAQNHAHLFYKEQEATGTITNFSVYQQEYAADGNEVTMKVLSKSKRIIFYPEHKQKIYG